MGFPGQHNTRVLKHSPIYLQQKYPQPGFCILGDGGYPCFRQPMALITPDDSLSRTSSRCDLMVTCPEPDVWWRELLVPQRPGGGPSFVFGYFRSCAGRTTQYRKPELCNYYYTLTSYRIHLLITSQQTNQSFPMFLLTRAGVNFPSSPLSAMNPLQDFIQKVKCKP